MKIAKTKALKPSSNVIPVVTAKPATPDQIKKTVWKISNLTTQEVDNLLEDEEESNVHIDEAEYNIGINQCAVYWLGVNFGSLFSNSGEFSGRNTAKIDHMNKFTDCEINTKTLDKQSDLLTKLDKQIQDCYRIQKQDKIRKEDLTKKLNASFQMVTNTTKENVNLKIDLQVQKDLVIALKLKMEIEKEKQPLNI